MSTYKFYSSIIGITLLYCAFSLKNANFKSLTSLAINNISDADFKVETSYKMSAPISLNNVYDKVISGLEIDNSNVSCIQLTNCHDITIQDCRFVSSKGNGVNIYHCKNITIKDCYMEKIATGVYAVKSQGINVLYNQVKNVQGPYPRGQMVQFNEVNGDNNSVSYNKCENIPGSSNAEDIINMFKTNGTLNSPVKIIGNWIRGGGPSASSGGIMLGDNGGSYIIADKNILVNPGQYGIAISSGTNIQITNNKIYSKSQRFTNVGLYVWNQYHSSCALNIVSGNMINWTNSKGRKNHEWNKGNCGPVNGWKSNLTGAKIDSAILPLAIITK